MRRAILILSLLTCFSAKGFSVNVYATAQSVGATGSCGSCSVSNPQNSVTPDTTDFAVITRTVSIPGAKIWQRLEFPSTQFSGTSVSVIVEDVNGQPLTPAMLSNVTLTSYLGSSQNNDMKTSTQYTITSWSDSKYVIGFAPATTYNAVQIDMAYLIAGAPNSIRVYAAFYTVAPLPVEMLYLQANNNDNKIKLDWATATETNNHYFTVERSMDGNRYDAVGKIDGAGNSISVLYYSFEDQPPLGGTWYYRIRQTDYDGRTSLSQVVAADYESDIKDLSIYPNPYREGSLLVAAHLDGADESSYIGIYSQSGMLVHKEELGPAGSFMQHTLQPVKLKPGIYTVKVVSGAHARTQLLLVE